MADCKINLFSNADSIKSNAKGSQLTNSQKAAKQLQEYFQDFGNGVYFSDDKKEMEAKMKKAEQNRLKREKILATKASNGLSYIEAQEIMSNIAKSFQGDFRTWQLDKRKSASSGIAHYYPDNNKMKALMNEEDRKAYENAEQACAELQGKYPQIEDFYESYRLQKSMGHLELINNQA